MIPLLFKPTKKRLWTPRDLATAPLIWLDAADASTIILNGGNVAQWNFKSSSGIISQSLASGQPAYSNNSVIFDGGDWLENNTPILWNAGAIALSIVGSAAAQDSSRIVSEASTLSSSQVYLFQTSSGANADRTGIFIRNDANTGLASFTLEQAFNSNRRIWGWIDTGTSITGVVDAVLGTSNPYTRTGTLTLDRFAVGALLRGTASSFFAGSINEIVATTNLNENIRLRIEGYLAHKWNLVANLAANHPYKYRPPTI